MEDQRLQLAKSRSAVDRDSLEGYLQFCVPKRSAKAGSDVSTCRSSFGAVSPEFRPEY